MASVDPGEVLSTAHSFLVKWDDLKEREQLWSELRTAMNVLGKAIAWELPARLRLVGVVVQVIDALANPAQTPIVSAAAQRWLGHMNAQKAHGKMEPLGLLRDLGSCMEGVEAGSFAVASPAVLTEAMEMQVLEAARSISLHLEPQVLEKALVTAVVAKDFSLAQQLLDELKLLSKFRAASDPAPESRAAPSETQPRQMSPPRNRGRAPVVDVSPETTQQLDLGDSEAASNVEDVEDTLAAMMDMGAEVLPVEAVVHSSTPPSPLPAKHFMDKRKREVLDEVIEDGSVSPRRSRAVSSRGHASSSSGNALFDAPIRAAELTSQPSSSSRERFSGEAFGGFVDNEVPVGGGGARTPWTTEEEQRLIAGHGRYGNRWEHIRKNCKLTHRFGTQLRDKWVNLVKSGRAKDN